MSNAKIPIGMDIGTGTSEIATLDDFSQPYVVKNKEGEEITPSVGYVDEDGVIIIGSEAQSEAYFHSDRVAKNFKREIGTNKILVKVNGKEYQASDFYRATIEKLKSDTETRVGKSIDKVVITVPANWNSGQRKCAKEAARNAGFEVLDIVSEPTAAAIRYGYAKNKDCLLMIVDYGGGTFDCTIIEVNNRQFKVIATDGVSELGGMDHDRELTNFLLDKLAVQAGYRPTPEEDPRFSTELAEKVTSLKHSLSIRENKKVFITYKGTDYEFEVTRAEFEQLIRPYIQKAIDTCEQALKAKGLTWQKIKAVILVGGPTRIPLISQMLEETSGKKPRCDIDPDRAVAEGAALLAAQILAEEKKETVITTSGKVLPSPKIHRQEVVSKDVGVIAIDRQNKQRRNCVIIRKNTPIPIEQKELFGIVGSKGDIVPITVVEGEPEAPEEECGVLDEFLLEGIAASPVTENRVRVKLNIERSGIVTVTAIDTITNKIISGMTTYEKTEGGTR